MIQNRAIRTGGIAFILAALLCIPSAAIADDIVTGDVSAALGPDFFAAATNTSVTPGFFNIDLAFPGMPPRAPVAQRSLNLNGFSARFLRLRREPRWRPLPRRHPTPRHLLRIPPLPAQPTHDTKTLEKNQ